MTTHLRMALLFCLAVFIGVQGLNAQTLELFGGYSFTNMKIDNITSDAQTHGWNTSFTAYPTSRVGLTADVAGFQSTVSSITNMTSGSTYSFPETSVNQFSFMAGPQVRLFRRARFETSFKALFGAARGYLPEPLPATVTYNPLDDTTFAALFGTNIDVNVSKKLALRFSPGLYLTQYGGETQKNFRFSVGPVFKFGGGESER